MSLALTANFVEKQNSVVPLAQNPARNGIAIRVASGGTDILGSLTASGATAPVVWSLEQAPLWITLSVDSTTNVATLAFSNAQAQTDPYQFYLIADDGETSQYFPIFLEVREPFSIASTTGATSFSIVSYDNTASDIVFQGIGLNGVIDSSVQFIHPASLPGGMNAITDAGTMRLSVANSGLTLYETSPVSQQVILKAYKPGTIYDNPDRCYSLPITIESLYAKQPIIDVGLDFTYNQSRNVLTATAYVDFLEGQPPSSYTFSFYQVSGTAVTSVVQAQGASTATFTVLIAGTAVFGVNVYGPNNHTLGSAQTAQMNVSINGSWVNTNAYRVIVPSPGAPSNHFAQNHQFTTSIGTLTQDLAAGETVHVTLSLVAATSLESSLITAFTTQAGSYGYGMNINGTFIPGGSPVTLTLTSAQASLPVQLLLPYGSIPGEKLILQVTAANATSNPTRTGYGQATILLSGPLPAQLGIVGLSTLLNSNVGTSGVLANLTATNYFGDAFLSASNLHFYLRNAPDGLAINTGSFGTDPASGLPILAQLTGNVLKPGYYIFDMVLDLVAAPNFSSKGRVNVTVTLVASAFTDPLLITDPVPSVTSLPDNQSFNVNWGYSGTPLTLNMIKGTTVKSVLGSTETTTSEVGSSVISIYGTSFYGDAYSVPTLVLSSSVTGNGDLPDAPTVGVIDENFDLTLKWTPSTVNGSFEAYKGWNISLKQVPNGTATLQTVNGQAPTGLEAPGATSDARIFTELLSPGDWQVSMQALTSDTTVAQNSAGWDAAHVFPTAITGSSVSFDNKTVSLGQPVNITLDANYIGADTWQAIYPDGTTSGWLPVSSKTVTKVFATPGNLPIVIQTQRDYSKANPPVKLMRQVTVTLFVMNQQYSAIPTSSVLTGTLGFGGEDGFEITDASTNAVPLAPYEVVVRALVRDTITNELKLMLASSRTADASSLLGTMAIDVFPILGRPRVADLIDPALLLTPEMATTGNPVRIATETLPTLVVGKPMNDFPLQVTANSGVAPFSWRASNLPFGVKLNTNGTLSGTPTELGTVSVDFSVMDSNTPPFISHKTLNLTVESDLAIPAVLLPQAVVNQPYSAPIGFSGGIPPFTWSIVAGAAPRGIMLDPSSGKLTGTPVSYNNAIDFSLPYTFTVQAVDAIGAIASTVFSMTLVPAALQFGTPDQADIFADEQFELTIPIFGGQAPYKLAAFSDDGTIGTGLRIVNPDSIAAVAGVAAPTLIANTATQSFYPEVYPYNAAFTLSATGGTAPYRFRIIEGNSTTLPEASISGSILTGLVSADGSYTVLLQVSDSLGNLASQTVTVTSQQKNASPYAIKPVSVNLNSSSNPANWTVTPLAALPDAKAAAAYNGGSGTYYGLALYYNNVLHMTQTPNPSNPMNFTIRSGALPGGLVAFSGNTFSGSTDYSGIQLFNVTGGSNPTVLGSYSFEAEFSNVLNPDQSATQCVARDSITVTSNGGGTTKVVVALPLEGTLQVDLASATGTPYPWLFPLYAEGGQAPYIFKVQSGSTLPGATVTTINNLPALASSSAGVGTYSVSLTATDANGVVSAPVAITVNIVKSATQPIHIVDSDLPSYIYANRPLPLNTYFIEADVAASWAATGLPAGITLSNTQGTRGYFSGTPTASGNFTASITATSLSFGTTDSQSVAWVIRPQAAVFLNPPASAQVGVSYRAINNHSIIQVQYTGYQPGDASLPLVTSKNGTVGKPGTFNANTPTVAYSNLTQDGFILSYDYECDKPVTDLLTLGNNIATISIPVGYSSLVATGQTIASTVSEYSQAANFTGPISVSGGLAPYTITPTNVSDSRFSISGNQVVANVALLPVGQMTPCSVSCTITDAAGNQTTATGILQITVRQETYIQANFYQNAVDFFNVSQGVATNTSYSNGAWLGYVILLPAFITPILGHQPFQYYVDSVTLPPALVGKMTVSPSNRVLAMQINDTNTSAQLPDLGPLAVQAHNFDLSGTFVVPAISFANAPPLGTYTIQANMRLVDAEGISQSQTVTLTVEIT